MSADLLTDLMGGSQGNNNSVTEESSCRKMPSQEHFVSDECLDVFPKSTLNGRAMRLPLLSMTLVCLIPRHWSTHSRHLGYTELPRYLWIATFLLLACHAWSSSEFILQGWFTWFTPLCHWKSANDFLAQKQHRLALHPLPDTSWQRGSHTRYLQLRRRCICKDIECTHSFAETCLLCDPHELRSKLAHVPLSHPVLMAMALLLQKGGVTAVSGYVTNQTALCGVMLSDFSIATQTDFVHFIFKAKCGQKCFKNERFLLQKNQLAGARQLLGATLV